MLGRRAETELGHLRLAQRHKARRQICTREVAVGGLRLRIPRVGAVHRRHARDRDVVLDEGRHAVEVAAVRTCGAAARARARSNASYASPFRVGLTASVRAIAASTSSDGETLPLCSASTRPTASRSPRASSPKPNACVRVMPQTVPTRTAASHPPSRRKSPRHAERAGTFASCSRGQAWPTSNRTNRVTVTPASSSSALTVFLLSDTDG